MENWLNILDPDTWPQEIESLVERHYATFEAWELSTAEKSPQAYDAAMEALGNALAQFSITGWHCTRLTDAEAGDIVSRGLDLLSADLLERRILNQVERRVIPSGQADSFLSKHEAHDSGRSGKIWFGFYPVSEAGEHGLKRLLSTWGGEALYNSHEGEPSHIGMLRDIGTPTLIEVDVPIADLRSSFRIAMAVARVAIAARGNVLTEPNTPEDYSIRRIEPSQIRRMLRFPQKEFKDLTGCDRWSKSPQVGRHP